MSKNRDKSLTVCVETIIKILTDIQASLPKEYRSDTILRNMFLNAVRDADTCPPACHKPSKTLQGIILDLHFSLASVPSIAVPTRYSSSNIDSRSDHSVGRRFVNFLSSRPINYRSNSSGKNIHPMQISSVSLQTTPEEEASQSLSQQSRPPAAT